LAFLGFGDQSCAAGWLEAKRLELWVGGKKQTNKEKRKGVYVGRTFGGCRSERERVEGEEEACDFCLFSL
jgi:hypothetical protein